MGLADTTILEAIEIPQLCKRWFRDPVTWAAWFDLAGDQVFAPVAKDRKMWSRATAATRSDAVLWVLRAVRDVARTSLGVVATPSRLARASTVAVLPFGHADRASEVLIQCTKGEPTVRGYHVTVD